MPNMTQAEGTRTAPFHGRDVVLQEMSGGQKVVLARLISKLQRAEGTATEVLNDVAKISDILYSAFVNLEDQDFIENLIIKRQTDLKEVALLVRGDDQEEEVKPKVRRGRPPKRATA